MYGLLDVTAIDKQSDRSFPSITDVDCQFATIVPVESTPGDVIGYDSF